MMLVCGDPTLLLPEVDLFEPVLVLVRGRPHAVGAADDVVTRVGLDVLVAADSWSIAVVAGEEVRAYFALDLGLGEGR